MKEDLASIFREGARENLQELEEALLILSDNFDDRKEVDRVFRVMHTIKGSSGMLGFEAIAHFSHALETEFDAVRAGKAVITPDIIQLALGARDHLERLIEREFASVSEPAPDGEPILLAMKAAIAGQQCRPDPRRLAIAEMIKLARGLVKQTGNKGQSAELNRKLLKTMADIAQLAQEVQLDSLSEFSQPFEEFLLELDRRHLRLTESATEVFLEGFAELEALLAPSDESVDFDPIALMAAMERPLIVAGKARHLLSALRHAAEPLTEGLKPIERLHWLKITLPEGRDLPLEACQALERLGICMRLSDDEPASKTPAPLLAAEASS